MTERAGGRASIYLRETVVFQIELVLLVNHVGLGFLLVGGTESTLKSIRND